MAEGHRKQLGGPPHWRQCCIELVVMVAVSYGYGMGGNRAPLFHPDAAVSEMWFLNEMCLSQAD